MQVTRNRWDTTHIAGNGLEDYSGDFIYAHLRASYTFNDHFSVALGYHYNEIDIEYRPNRRRLTALDVKFAGPTIQFGYGF